MKMKKRQRITPVEKKDKDKDGKDTTSVLLRTPARAENAGSSSGDDDAFDSIWGPSFDNKASKSDDDDDDTGKGNAGKSDGEHKPSNTPKTKRTRQPKEQVPDHTKVLPSPAKSRAKELDISEQALRDKK